MDGIITDCRTGVQTRFVATPVPPPSQAQIIEQHGRDLSARLDAFAMTRTYGGIMSAASFSTSSVPQFAIEGRRALELRDTSWSRFIVIMDAVRANTRAMPTREQLVQELPALTW